MFRAVPGQPIRVPGRSILMACTRSEPTFGASRHRETLMATAAKASIPILISEDRLRAEVIPARVDPGLLTAESLLARLKERGIRIDDDVATRVNRLAEAVRTGERSKNPYLLAQGKVPVDAVGATVELAAAHHDLSEDERADFYESHILTVNEGDKIGVLTPGSPAVPGVDVYGKPVPGAPAINSVEVGENIRVEPDGRTLIAVKAGKVHLARQRVAVLDVVQISGDVDFSTGNVDSPADVLVTGTVRDTFAVKSARSIAIRGAIEGAVVEAAGDVQVSGGIAGRQKAQVVAGGDLATKFCIEASIRAGGNVSISRECMNSRVHVAGRLLMSRGKLVGGFAYAGQGAEIAVAGNEAERPTEIAVGLDPEALAEILRMDELLKKKAETCAKIREKVQPLMAQLKRLTPQQREKATELLYQADEIEAEINRHSEQRKTLLTPASATDRPVITVLSMIYPGVKVIFGDKMAIFRKERKGPIKLERRLLERVEEICLIERASGSLTIMRSYEFKPEPAPAPAAQAPPQAAQA